MSHTLCKIRNFSFACIFAYLFTWSILIPLRVLLDLVDALCHTFWFCLGVSVSSFHQPFSSWVYAVRLGVAVEIDLRGTTCSQKFHSNFASCPRSYVQNHVWGGEDSAIAADNCASRQGLMTFGKICRCASMFLLLFQLHTLSSLETGCGGCHQPGAAKACKMTGFIVDMYILLSNCLQTQRIIDSESSSRCFPLLALFGRKNVDSGMSKKRSLPQDCVMWGDWNWSEKNIVWGACSVWTWHIVTARFRARQALRVAMRPPLRSITVLPVLPVALFGALSLEGNCSFELRNQCFVFVAGCCRFDRRRDLRQSIRQFPT